jgi:hypothetical protein
MLSTLDIIAPGRTPGERRRAIQRTWSDEVRAARASYAAPAEWSVPECRIDVSFPHVRELEDRVTTQTINRWRKSVAKTKHGAELCLELELEASEPCSVSVFP